MASIFKELEDAIIEVKSHKPVGSSETEKKEQIRLKKAKLQALGLLQEYIDGGRWFESGSRRDLFLEYYKLPIKIYAKQVGKSEDSVRHVINRASAKLRKQLGSDIISNIVRGDMKSISTNTRALRVLNDAKPLISNFSTKAITVNGNKKPVNSYNIKDLTNEITFLRVYSDTFFKQYMESINEDKLAFLIDILSKNKDKNYKEQIEFFNNTQTVSSNKLIISLLSCIKSNNMEATLKLLKATVDGSLVSK